MADEEKVVPMAERRPFREIGRTGNSEYQALVMEDYNPDMRGGLAIEMYDKMRRNDAKVRASLRIVKAPLLSGQWYIDQHQHEGSVEEGNRVADFAWWALNNMKRGFTKTLSEILSFLDFGFYPFEVVYEFGEWEGERVVKWKKWGTRHPKTLQEWLWDKGEVAGLKQSIESGSVDIPLDKLLLFTFDEEASNPEGMSLLRSAYKNWFFKEKLEKVDGIQKERHGIGVPDILLPPNYTDDDVKFAQELGKNLRTNEKSFILRRPGMEVSFVQISGSPVDVLASVGYHDLMIAANVLAQFLNLGSSDTGSRAISESQQEMFSRAVRYISDLVRDVINRELKHLLRMNDMDDSFVELKVRRIGEAADWRALSVALRNLVEPGMLTAEPNLEHFIREIMDLPHGESMATERGWEDRLPKGKRAEEDEPREGSKTGGPKD